MEHAILRNVVSGLITGVGIVAPLHGGVSAQGLPAVQREFSNGATLRFYGQINKGVLQYDDGIATESYGLIDNDNSNTRFGLRYTQEFGDWTFENVNEIAYAPFSTADINIVNDSATREDFEFSNSNIRKLDFTLENDRYGKFWLGQGSMATDGTLEVDLSGTGVIAYSGVADSASAQIIRFSDPDLTFDESLSGIEIGDVFDNLDGDRRVRVRYDSPEYANFVVAAAFGRNLLSDNPDVREANLFDASINYGNAFNDTIEVEAALGYNWSEGIDGADDASIWGGSASALHTPSGVNLTFALGSEDDGGSFWYGKLGLLRGFIAWGDTAVSVDYYSGDDFGLDEDAGITGTSSDSWGLALVQKIDRANTELWLTYRSYDYGDDFASYEDGRAIFGGARFRF